MLIHYNRSKWIVFLTILSLCFFMSYSVEASVGSIRINRENVKVEKDKNGNIYRIYKTPEITVITPKKFSFHFYKEGTTMRTFVNDLSCSAGLNWSYFWFNPDGTYFPAWVWYKYGKYIREPYQPAIDKNLRVLLSWNGTTIDPMVNDTFDFASIAWIKTSWYVNAGPRLVRDGRINHDVVDNKSHRQRKARRVWFIRNPNGEIHFVVATQPISLPQFVVFAFSTGLGKEWFQFVNLDGWSSTSLWTPYNSYQTKRKLPIFICIQ